MPYRAWLVLALAASAGAQTTQSLISGGLTDSLSARAVAGARIEVWNLATNATASARSDAGGFYALPLLSPGQYRLRVEADDYQAQEIYELQLPVASRLDLDFRLRPLKDVWEQGQYRSVFLPGSRTVVTFYGPDVDSSRSSFFEVRGTKSGVLESAISDVIDTSQIASLPLAGRDVYSTLVTQPAVSTDAALGRGLGLSIAGQRPSSSNFLLDGLENNNYLVTGPLTTIAPETVQEYRASTSNYSAAYGRTSGYIANTVSRSGGQEFHGLGYYYLKNDALNANEFQRNRAGEPRKKVREHQFGYQVGGYILKDRLFFSSALERLDSKSEQDPLTVGLPTPNFVPDYTAPGSLSRELLEAYPPPPVEAGVAPWAGTLTVSPPTTVSRYLTIQRVDYRPRGGADLITGRLAYASLARPDFIWSPYEDFVSGLDQDSVGLGVAYMRTLRPGLTNEAKLGWNRDTLGWDRAHPEIPTLVSGDGVTLPGSPAFYAYRNQNPTWELLDNVTWSRGRHVLAAGGGFLSRGSEGFLTAGRDGQYGFGNLILFGIDRPAFFSASVARETLPALEQPAFDREYRYRQYFLFAQDSFRATPRLVINAGLRYEYFGAPSNTGPEKDAAVELGPGGDIQERIANARLIFPASGSQALYPSDRTDWAIRFGLSYDLLGGGRTILRASYGLFYDRPFDNLWQNTRNNNITLPLFLVRQRFDYLQPIGDALELFEGQPVLSDFPALTTHDPGLRTGYAQSFFGGVLHRFTDDLSLEVNGLGTLGRGLITTDVLNRQFTLAEGDGRPNPALPDIAWRAGQGLSDYYALAAAVRYRASRAQFQASYTWSHAIDNQSEPLAGDFFDLSFTRISAGGAGIQRSAFSRQYDSRADRGNADFDQRHNLVLFGIWDLPAPGSSSFWAALLRDWRTSVLAAFRSGFPYSVFTASEAEFGQGLILNNRANVVDPALARPSDPPAVDGGRLLLDARGFGAPGPSQLGNSGRNSFPGPGFYSINFSLSRSFPLSFLGESGRLTLRADAFNILNHANLNPPDSLLQSETFGYALYGRRGKSSGFPAVSPLNESAREIQLMLRVEF